MQRGVEKAWKVIGLPLIFLLAILSLWAIWKILDLPLQKELVDIARRYFELYGYWIVFVSAIIEGLLLAGWYYPGSLVIFLGVIFAGRNIPEVLWVILLVTLGLVVAYLADYALGRFGWYRLFLKVGLREPIENARRRLVKYGLSGIFVSYWHPNLAALTSTAAGILRFPFNRFFLYSITATIIWNIFWGALVYFLGESALSAIGIRFLLVILTVWIAYRLIYKRKQEAPDIPLG